MRANVSAIGSITITLELKAIVQQKVGRGGARLPLEGSSIFCNTTVSASSNTSFETSVTENARSFVNVFPKRRKNRSRFDC